MYYSKVLFLKKGPLSKMWMAGTVIRKLSKQQILSSSISDLCQQLLEPPTKLALRTRATLALGICRIENKKACYYQTFAIELRSKLRGAEIAVINLPVDQLGARSDKITILDQDALLMMNDVTLGTIDEQNWIRQIELEENVDIPMFHGVEMSQQVNLSGSSLDPREEMQIPEIDDFNIVVEDAADANFSVSAMGMELEMPEVEMMDNVNDVAAPALDAVIDAPPAVGDAAPTGSEAKDDEQKAAPAQKKRRRRHDLAVPATVVSVTELSNEQMRDLLHNTEDIVTERPRKIVKASEADLATPQSRFFCHCSPDLTQLLASALPDIPVKSSKGRKKKDKSADESKEKDLQEHRAAEEKDENELNQLVNLELEMPEIDYAIPDAGGEDVGTPNPEHPWQRRESRSSGTHSVDLPRASAPRRDSFLGVDLDFVSQSQPASHKARQSSGKLDVSLGEFEESNTLDSAEPISQFVLSIRPEQKEEENMMPAEVTRYTRIFRERVKACLKDRESVKFDRVLPADVSKKDAGLAFMQLLVLATCGVVEVSQDSSEEFAVIDIVAGPNFTHPFRTKDEGFAETPITP